MSKKQMSKENQGKTNGCSRDVKLLAYCAMAGGALVAAQPANAAVVYSGVKDLKLTDNGTIKLDLDGGGVVDFEFRNLIGPKHIDYSSFSHTYYNDRSDANLLLLGKNPENAIGGMRRLVSVGAPLQGAQLGGSYFSHIGNFNLSAGTPIPNNSNLLWFWLDGMETRKTVDMPQTLTRSVYFPLSYGNFSSGPVAPPAVGPEHAAIAITWNYANIYGTFANQPAGFLGVKFDMHGTTHYGWVRYQGTDEDNATTPTVLTGTIKDWAYQDKPDTIIYAGQLPDCIDKDGDGYGLYCSKGPDCDDNNSKAHDNCTCIDKDGDGYGVGPGCKGPDCDDTDNKTHENCPPCAVKFWPGKLSKTLSSISSLAGFVISGDTAANFSKTTKIKWGTKNISTVLQVPLGKKTIFALVYINASALETGDIYDVLVDNCAGELTVKSL